MTSYETELLKQLLAILKGVEEFKNAYLEEMKSLRKRIEELEKREPIIVNNYHNYPTISPLNPWPNYPNYPNITWCKGDTQNNGT